MVFKKGYDPNRGPGFKPGVSGNPGGRPRHRINEIAEAAGEHAQEVLELMLAAMRDKDAGWTARIAAGLAVWDRCLGKPLQTMRSMQEDVNLEELTDAELTVIIRREQARDNPTGTEGDQGQPH